jgi:hypothetical protein
MHSQSNAH